MTHKIGTLNEKALHAALKEWYARPGDQLEAAVDGYHVDILREGLLVEIQTGGFAAIKRKLVELVPHHSVRLVYPIAREKWIVKLRGGGKSRRKSPKRGALEELFVELVSFPELLASPNFSLEVLFIQEEEVRHHDPTRAWRRRGWVTQERRLLQVVGQRLFRTPADMGALVPPTLPQPFTTLELATAIARPRWLAQKMAYCLRAMGVIEPAGKRGNAILYTRGPA
jgi:hypothetical protein